MRIGLREANQAFSKLVKAVKSGQEVVLTERGTPVAVLTPLPGSVRAGSVVRALRAAGLLRPASKPLPMPGWRPRPLRGVPMSRTIREERDRS